MAGVETLPDWEAFARRLFRLPDAQVSSVVDDRQGRVRLALSEGGILRAALFCEPQPVALSRTVVTAMIGSAAPFVLAGQAGSDRPDPGQTVCACLSVGRNTIRTAIRDGRCCNLDQLGALLGAGSNGGSCKPELRALLAETMQAAE